MAKPPPKEMPEINICVVLVVLIAIACGIGMCSKGKPDDDRFDYYSH